MPETAKFPPLGTIGRIFDPNKGMDWGRDYRVVSWNQGPNPSLHCETLDRLRHYVEPSKTEAGGWVTDEDKPFADVPSIPVDWFQAGAKAQATPSEPHAHMTHEAATHARAPESVKPRSS